MYVIQHSPNAWTFQVDTNANAKWAIMETEKTVRSLMNVSLVSTSATNLPLVSTHEKAMNAAATKVMKEMDSPVRTLMNAPTTRMTAASTKMVLSVLTPTGRTCVLVEKVSLGMGRRVPTLTSVRLVLTTAPKMPSALIGREVSPVNAHLVSMETQQRNALVSTVTSEYAGSSFRIFRAECLNPGWGGRGVLHYKGLIGTCDRAGYVLRDFCPKQGIELIIFCLTQGSDLSIFVN